MDQNVVPQPPDVGAGERGPFEGVHARVFGPAELLSVTYSLCPCFVALLRRLRDGTANPVLLFVLFAGCVRATVFAYVDDITVFVFRRSDIKR